MDKVYLLAVCPLTPEMCRITITYHYYNHLYIGGLLSPYSFYTIGALAAWLASFSSLAILLLPFCFLLTQKQLCSSLAYVSAVITPLLHSQTNITSAYMTMNCQIIEMTTKAMVDDFALESSFVQSVSLIELLEGEWNVVQWTSISYVKFKYNWKYLTLKLQRSKIWEWRLPITSQWEQTCIP